MAVPIVCFSHLRWDFVWQRPQHLLQRFARNGDVWVWEEHIPCDHPLPYLEHHHFAADNVTALRPRLPHWWNPDEVREGLRRLYDQFAKVTLRVPPVLWYYTPLMLGFTDKTAATAVVYDCMDELSQFSHADPLLISREADLFDRADVVFTGGQSLYEAKRTRHGNVHAFPSAVDKAHFAQARGHAPASVPTLGYYGVIDERLDLALVGELARARPDWQIEMVGPVVKIDPAGLPRHHNLHWLGQRGYGELPAVLGRWHVALMPFALNSATRFISPTKTPEYLAGGKPVVSTAVRDVVATWGETQGVWIAEGAQAFVRACDEALAVSTRMPNWIDALDAKLAAISWDLTGDAMRTLIDEAIAARAVTSALPSRLASHAPPHDTLVRA